jgi:hypothetical protein
MGSFVFDQETCLYFKIIIKGESNFKYSVILFIFTLLSPNPSTTRRAPKIKLYLCGVPMIVFWLSNAKFQSCHRHQYEDTKHYYSKFL